MNDPVTSDTLHRGAKYFMDSGRATNYRDAIGLLCNFGLYIVAGPELNYSRDHQIALLTLVNTARRTFLGGVRVGGHTEGPSLTPLVAAASMKLAIEEMGGTVASENYMQWPVALIGTCPSGTHGVPQWQVTWDGWRGGVASQMCEAQRLRETPNSSLAAALAAAICASEAFTFYAGDHPMAGRRSAGLSLWKPGADWLMTDDYEPKIAFLPSHLWIIGLGNLGQAYLWMLTSLPYQTPEDVHLVLQDDDRVARSNDSTSILTQQTMIGRMKSRALAEWLEARRFQTLLTERRFDGLSRRALQEPSVALCGVDNEEARSYLETAGFGLVIEAGLGSGTQAFRNFSVHTFPSSIDAARMWSLNTGVSESSALTGPAYDPREYPHLDECGLAQLASRAVGVPFVGLTVAALVIGEVLRRLHSGSALELVAGSLMSLEDIEVSATDAAPYDHGFTTATNSESGVSVVRHRI